MTSRSPEGRDRRSVLLARVPLFERLAAEQLDELERLAAPMAS